MQSLNRGTELLDLATGGFSVEKMLGRRDLFWSWEGRLKEELWKGLE